MREKGSQFVELMDLLTGSDSSIKPPTAETLGARMAERRANPGAFEDPSSAGVEVGTMLHWSNAARQLKV